MSFEKSAPPSVMERFPDASHVVDEQYRSNTDFRELVDHFDECEGVLAQLMSRSDCDRARVDEYQMLIAELREEIVMALSALSKQSALSKEDRSQESLGRQGKTGDAKTRE